MLDEEYNLDHLPCDDEHISDSEASSISSKHDSQTVDDKNVLHSKKANRTGKICKIETVSIIKCHIFNRSSSISRNG